MDNIGVLIKDILKKQGLWGVVKQHEIIIRWPEIVGKKIAQNTEAVKINKGTLWIKVKDSIWMHHLSMMKPQLKEKINKLTDKKMVNELFFYIGDFPDNNDSPKIEE